METPGTPGAVAGRSRSATCYNAVMAIYRRDPYLPEWEPIPWKLAGEEADAQEHGFHERALKPLVWTRVDWKNFPPDGIFGYDRDWFVSNDIAYVATFGDEDLVLIDNTWAGFPDPPRWGLASRATGAEVWQMWGHFPDLPNAWTVPGEVDANAD